MIEKTIHICWFGPHLPPTEMIETWEKKHVNGWMFVLWRDHTGWQNQEQIDKRAARNEWNGVCDAIRPEILHKHGGFVLDADSICLKALDEGPIDFLSNDTAVACFESETVRPGMVACGFLGAPKGHSFFKACIEEVAVQDPNAPAWKAIGPMLMTRMANKYPDQIKVYPSKMFIPTHFSGAAAPGNHPIYADQKFGSTKSYNSLRKQSCQCHLCRQQNMLRPSWG